MKIILNKFQFLIFIFAFVTSQIKMVIKRPKIVDLQLIT